MSRFNRDFRDSFGNKICRHFDKYCEITNPLSFCPIEDLYRVVFSRREWVALCRLLDTTLGKKCLQKNASFCLYLGNASTHKHSRLHVSFGFHDEVLRPSLDIEYDDIPFDVRGKLDTWLRKAKGLKQLRRELFKRCDRLLDWGWEKQRHYNNHGGWRGGPEPGQGCNTPGQVHRIWPELLAFFPAEEIGVVRGASVKSRLPDTILDYGTVDQFLCKERWDDGYHENGDPVTDEDMKYELRKFEALTHILVQMSLMKDVPHVKGYPNVVGY